MALSARGLFLSRLMPVLLILTTTYIIPWAKRTYLIFGFSGKNFEQTDMTNWDIIYPDKLIGCEDLHVYNADSGPMIFTGCVEKLEHQLTWFPGITARNKSHPGYYQAPFYVYEPASDKLTQLKIENFPADTDRVWHGIDLLETSPGNILIYAINHRRDGSMIERFHHTIGSGKMVYERSFDCKNDIVFTPNDIAVVGKDEFYVTNDHVAVEGIWRFMVDLLRLPLCTVAYHDRTKGFRTVAKGIKGANGITAEKPGNRIIVSAIMAGEMLVYERSEGGNLTMTQVVELDFLPDNPTISPNGDLIVTGVPNVMTAIDHNPDLLVHSKVVRIPMAQLGDKFFGRGSGQTAKPVIEPIVMDVTGKLNASTTTVEVSFNGGTYLYSTSWRAMGLSRCKLS